MASLTISFSSLLLEMISAGAQHQWGSAGGSPKSGRHEALRPCSLSAPLAAAHSSSKPKSLIAQQIPSLPARLDRCSVTRCLLPYQPRA